MPPVDTWWYHLSVYLHILCAVIWIGGMLFIVMVLAPLLRTDELRPQAVRLLQAAGRKFKTTSWTCFAVLLVTGCLNTWARYGHPGQTWGGFWTAVTANPVLVHKLRIFVLVVCLSWLHDFNIGPKAVALMQRAPDSPAARRLRATAAWMGRLNLLFGLAILWAAMRLARP